MTQRMFENWKRHGETDVKVWAFIVHCNNKKISGFTWKGSCFMVSYFCSNSNCQKRNYVSTSIKKIGNVAHYMILLLLVER